MKLRLVIALTVVLALFFGGGLIASADDDQPNCWWVSYTVTVMGTKIVKIPNSCIPCMGLCDWLPPPPSLGKPKPGQAVVIFSGG
ncbi:MAG: hypothetical protein ACRDHY_05415 [Anaerolineales bacterium]